MTPSEQLQRELEGLTMRSRDSIEAIIQESQSTVDSLERLKWHIAAETTAMQHVQRLLDYREGAVRDMVTRLNMQLPPPPAEPLVGYDTPPEPQYNGRVDEGTIAEVLKNLGKDSQQRRYG
jgi:hypothetical protein